MLTPRQRTFITVEQIIVPFLFNLAFNAAFGWYAFRAHVPVPLWGDPSIGLDILGMLFFLPFFTCLVGTPLINRATRLGKVDKLTIAPEEHWLLRHLPRSLWLRSIGIGVACVVALGPVSIGLLALLDLHSWTLSAAIPFKGVYAGVLAAIVTPPIALYALSRHEAPSSEATTP
jgi:hypothetical protein